MNLKLVRTDFDHDGIFGLLKDEAGNVLMHTLEHAYDAGLGNGSYMPKLPPGVYKCVRGQHRLHSMTHDFTTFEITGVTGHTNILFHSGNAQNDSQGCVLVGQKVVPWDDETGDRAVIASKAAFAKLLDLQKDVDQFTLTVE